jgi:hypothetical protein
LQQKPQLHTPEQHSPPEVQAAVLGLQIVVGAAHESTVMAALGVVAPNQATPSRSILHWKLYVLGVLGAVTVKENVLDDPGAIESDDDM